MAALRGRCPQVSQWAADQFDQCELREGHREESCKYRDRTITKTVTVINGITTAVTYTYPDGSPA